MSRLLLILVLSPCVMSLCPRVSLKEDSQSKVTLSSCHSSSQANGTVSQSSIGLQLRPNSKLQLSARNSRLNLTVGLRSRLELRADASQVQLLTATNSNASVVLVDCRLEKILVTDANDLNIKLSNLNGSQLVITSERSTVPRGLNSNKEEQEKLDEREQQTERLSTWTIVLICVAAIAACLSVAYGTYYLYKRRRHQKPKNFAKTTPASPRSRTESSDEHVSRYDPPDAPIFPEEVDSRWSVDDLDQRSQDLDQSKD